MSNFKLYNKVILTQFKISLLYNSDISLSDSPFNLFFYKIHPSLLPMKVR